MSGEPKDTTVADQVSAFGNRTISHPKLTAAFTEVMNLIKQRNVSMVEVIGPTGVGKTTLLKRLYSESLELFRQEMADNPGLIPVIKIEAAAPESGMFQWQDYYLRILREFREPMMECKTVPTLPTAGLETPQRKSTLNSLRWAVEQAIRFRGARVIIIDEAQHLTKTPSARRLADQMDVIKSLASLTGTQFVLVGTYELRLLLNQNGQLARRIRSVHFGRYDYRDIQERQEFVNVLAMFERRLPLAGNGLLTDQLDYIYKNCFGCVGILKEWLHLALECVAKSSREKLLKSDLEAAALPTASLKKIYEEIAEGEKAVVNQTAEDCDLALKLGLSTTANSQTTPAKSVNRPVGQRSPQRDPVGVPYGVYAFSGSH